jgi:hypothetical protein
LTFLCQRAPTSALLEPIRLQENSLLYPTSVVNPLPGLRPQPRAFIALKGASGERKDDCAESPMPPLVRHHASNALFALPAVGVVTGSECLLLPKH